MLIWRNGTGERSRVCDGLYDTHLQWKVGLHDEVSGGHFELAFEMKIDKI